MTVSPRATLPTRPISYWICYAAILLLAVAVRFVPIRSGLPYSDYVDEGHVLHQTIDAFEHGNLDVYWYGLPALPAYSAGAALFLYGPFYRHLHGHRFQEDLPIDRTLPSSKSNYDLITPVELIVAGRIITALLSVASVILAGIIAARLANSKAALFAMLLVAICPALVTRASIVIVDTFAAFFVLVTLYFCLRTQTGMSETVWREIALAGVATGLTFASKYPVAIVGVAVLTSILRLSPSWSRLVRLVAFAAGAVLLGILLGAPMTFFKPLTVWRDVVENVRAYTQIQSTQGYIAQAISNSELGVPLLVVGLAGIILMLCRDRTRGTAVAWLVFAVFLIGLFINSSFRPFRSFLSLVPLWCIAAAIALSGLVDWALAKKEIWWRSAMAFVLVCLCFGSLGFSSYHQIKRRIAHEDTRIQAVNWLRERTSSRDTIVAVHELMILPTEWQRILANVVVVPWFEAADLLERQRFDYIVTGEFDLRYATDPAGWSAYQDRWRRKVESLALQADFGQIPTPVAPYLWRTNEERILIIREFQ